MTEDDASPNKFESGKPDTAARSKAQASIDGLRQRGGIFVDAVRATRTPMALTAPNLPGNPIVFANRSFLDLSGYSLEEVLGQQPFFMNGPGTDPRDAARFREALEQDRDENIETIQYRKDGSRFVASLFLSAFKDDEDRTLHHFLSWLDVTRRVAAEDDADTLCKTETALRESEELSRLIVENARDYAIFITDPDGRIVEWLPGAEAVFGWTAQEAIGRPAAITFTPEDQAERVPEWETGTAAREGLAPDVRWHQRKDGSHVFIEGRVTPLRHGDGSVRGFLKIGQDVSERRSAQEALEASERRMRSLATGIPQLVFRSTGRGDRIWGSPQWIAFTGLSFGESVGFGWLNAVHPDERQATLDAWDGVEERGEYYCEHRVFEAATGSYRWHQTRATPLRDDEGGILEWLGTSTDVEDLRRLQRHQQVLVGELQHRVRNTLAVIRSIAQRTAATSDTVEAMSAHLQGRIGAFSRVQAVVTRSPEAGVDLTTLVEDELLAYAAKESETLRIKGPPIWLRPRAAESLSLAIHELTTNAVKYGALASERGGIAVEWGRTTEPDGSESLRLRWQESGVDHVDPEPPRRGFGLELLQRSLPYDLDAETEVEFRPHGLRFELRMPLKPHSAAQ